MCSSKALLTIVMLSGLLTPSPAVVNKTLRTHQTQRGRQCVTVRDSVQEPQKPPIRSGVLCHHSNHWRATGWWDLGEGSGEALGEVRALGEGSVVL